MGKGDKKSKRGKISRGSYGKTRPSKWNDATYKKPEADSTNSL
ncbi:30S ribosomal protein THX [Spirosoma linguale]